MADVKISGLPASTTPLAGTEVLPIVQGGQTRQVSVDNLTTGKAVTALNLTLTGVATVPAGTAAAPSITTTGDTNTGVFFPAADTVAIGTNGTSRVRVDSSGNVGVGVTPSAWGAALKSIDISRDLSLSTSNAGSVQAAMSVNAYNNGTNWLGKLTGSTATIYNMSAGLHQWMTSPSATTANVAFTPTVYMQISPAGGVSIGNLTDPGASNLSVTGTIYSNGIIRPQQATTAAAPAYVKGAIYFDTTLNKLRVGGATAWETISST